MAETAPTDKNQDPTPVKPKELQEAIRNNKKDLLDKPVEVTKEEIKKNNMKWVSSPPI